jgi:hypothetical protein
MTAFKDNIDFDRRVAAAIKDFSADNVGDGCHVGLPQ